ncbi:MAG: trigger factor [Ruminococcus sp.]|jgi:trigger factor|nr:trigger factor [Ruminococcus sp.]
MSLLEKSRIETNKYEFIVTVSPERFEQSLNDAYLKARGKITVNGFRKGKAPRKMIEKIYGGNCFFEDAVELLIPQVVEKDIEESGVELITQPELEIEEITKQSGVKFKLTGYSKPEITVGDYKGIHVVKNIKPVTDEDVRAEIETIRSKNARIITVDRPSQNGDTVTIDFKGYRGGVAFDGGESHDYDLKLGSNTLIPGFEDQIVGKNPGDEFTINVTFPENYQMEELAGQPAEFEIKLHTVKAEELPEFDDEFVKDISEFDTVDEFTADLKERLEKSNIDYAEAEAEDATFKALAEMVKDEIPEIMYEKQIDQLVREFEYRVRAQGLDMDTYYALTGTTAEQNREQYKEKAELQVKIRLALEKIAELEGIVISDEQAEAEIARMAEDYKMPVEKIRNIISVRGIKSDLAVNEASKIVKDNVVMDIVE